MLELLADVALHPSFPDIAVQTAREDMVADIQEEEEDPVGLAFRSLRRLCFGSVSYGNSPGGTCDSVRNLSRAALLTMHAALMQGQNAVLSLAGDIGADSLTPLVNKLFGPMPAGQGCEFCATPAQQQADVQIPAPADKEQAVLAIALPALPLHHPDVPKLLLLDEWCQDMAGPVYSEIREKRGLAYHASSCLLRGVDAGCLFFSLETAPHLIPQARSAMEQLLTRLAEQGMPAEALERARATSLSSRRIAAQSLGKVCSATAVDTVLGLGHDHAERMMSALACVTHSEMQEFIRRLFAPGNTRTYLTLLSE